MRRGVVNPAALAAVILWMTGPALAVTYQVNSNGDGPDANTADGTCETSTPGQCTLRAAVQQANVTGGTINVPAMTITLTDYLAVQHDMSIVGAGMRATVVSGAGLYQIFDVGSPVATPLTVTISDMTLRDGHANAFNGGDGVAIHQYQGKLTVDRCFFTNNYATYGGAILADHTETKIRDSVFTDNHAPDGIAGAIWAFASSLTMINVALTGNSADTGGALVLTLGSYGTLTNVTFGDNIAVKDGGAIAIAGGISVASSLVLYSSTVAFNQAYGLGAGIYVTDSDQSVSIQNTVFSGNAEGCPACFKAINNCHGTITSLGKAVVTTGVGCTVSGTSTSADPKLGPLQDNGGPNGPTFALKAGSSAIDSGTVGGCPLTDQRGVQRQIGVACDMGAYESSPCGDANGDGSLSVADVFFLINYLFAGGPIPPGLANVDGDGVKSVSDVFYLINHLFAGGPAGQCPGT